MKYSFKIKNYSPVEYTFRDDGVISSVQFPDDMQREQVLYLKNRIPVDPEELMELKNRIPGAVLTEIAPDLTFDSFWNRYNYKVGNKKRAHKLWSDLKDADRVAALKAIARYEAYLQAHPRMEKAFAETFLYQRRWENQY